MANKNIEIETHLSQLLGFAKTKGRQRYKKFVKKMRNRNIRRSDTPEIECKKYDNWEY